MMDQNLINKANQYLGEGKTLDQVKEQLVQEGWTLEQINTSFSEYAAQQENAVDASMATSTPPASEPTPVTPPEKAVPKPIAPVEPSKTPQIPDKPQSSSEAPTTPPTSAPPSKSKLPLIILVTVLLIALGTGAYFLLRGGTDEQTTMPESDSEMVSLSQPTESDVAPTNNEMSEAIEAFNELPIDPATNLNEATSETPSLELEDELKESAMDEPQPLPVSDLSNASLPKLPSSPTSVDTEPESETELSLVPSKLEDLNERLALEMKIEKEVYQVGEGFEGEFSLKKVGGEGQDDLFVATWLNKADGSRTHISGASMNFMLSGVSTTGLLRLTPGSYMRADNSTFDSPGYYRFEVEVYSCEQLGLSEETCTSDLEISLLEGAKPLLSTTQTIEVKE